MMIQIDESAFDLIEYYDDDQNDQYDFLFKPNMFALLFLPLICVIGFIGNAMVCIAIATDRRLQNITNYFLFSLALADLLVCTIVMPLAILAEVRHGFWTWNFAMCFIYVYSDVFLCSASIVHMSMISLDRYLGISQPLKNRNKSRNIVILKICTVWIITLAISSPLAGLAIYNPENILYHNICAIDNRLYMAYGSILSFLIPFIIMTVTYVKTTQLLNKQASLLTQKTNDRFHNGLRRTLPHRKLGCVSSYSVGNTQTSTNMHKTSVMSYTSCTVAPQTPKQSHNGDTRHLLNNSSTDTDDIQPNGEIKTSNRNPRLGKQSSALRLQIGKLKNRTSSVLNQITTKVGRKNSLRDASTELANEHKATRVLAVVFLCFFICWTPFFITNITYSACGKSCEVPPWIGSIFLWLGYISSTINPIIYTIFNRRFRQAFLRIIRCQCMHSYRDQNINYSRNHTFVPPDTHTWSNFDKSMNSNGKDMSVRTFTPPRGYRNTTAMGLLAAGSRAISAPAGPLILPTVNNMDYWSKKLNLDSPDSVGNVSVGWNTLTPPLRQAIFSSFRNKQMDFENKSENRCTKENENSYPSSPNKSNRSSNSSDTTCKSIPEDDREQLQDLEATHPMQISDYDNLHPERMLRYSSNASSDNDKPSITQNTKINPSPQKFVFSAITSSSRNTNFIQSNQMQRSLSDNFPTQSSDSSPPIAKYNIIKSTTVTEQLSNYQNQLPPSAFIVALPNNVQVLAIKRPTDLSLKNEKSSKSSQCFTDNGTPIDCTVQSGVLMNGKGKINETYL